MRGREDCTREEYDRGQAAVDRQFATLVPGGKRQPGQPGQLCRASRASR